jgi:hypothetical protein
MSDYFDALMVSSGLAAAPVPKTAAPAANDASDDIIEIDAAGEADAASTPMPQHRPSPPPDLPQDAGRVGKAKVSVSSAAAARSGEQAPPPAGSAPPRAPAPAPGHDAVRAALDWIAADPQHADEMHEPRTQSSAAVAATAAHAGQRSLAGFAVEDRATDPPQTTPRPDLAHDEADSHFAPAISSPSDRRTGARPADDEIVEVTIGAIHVHVDAPPQTIVPPPTPPQPASPPWDQPAARSGLSRRILRRL